MNNYNEGYIISFEGEVLDLIFSSSLDKRNTPLSEIKLKNNVKVKFKESTAILEKINKKTKIYGSGKVVR